MEAAFKVKMQAKDLEREASKCTKEANKQRNLAKAALQKGNRAEASMHAQNATRYEQQAQRLLQNCSTVTGMAIDIKTAETTSQIAGTMHVATDEIETTVGKMNLEKVAKDSDRLAAVRGRIGAANELFNGEGQMEVTAATDEIMAALEDEINMDAMMKIEAIPQAAPQAVPNAAGAYGVH